MKYYDVVGEDDLEIDGFDRSLSFIRLQWQKNKGEVGRIETSKTYGLPHIDNIRGLVHCIPADFGVDEINETVPRMIHIEKLGKWGDEGWSTKLFYLNRFYRGR